MRSWKYILLLAVFQLFVHCKPSEPDVYRFRVSLWANQEHTWFQAFQYFAEILHERSEGKIKVEVYPSEQLAKELESIRLIQAGVIDMTVTASLLSNWIEIAAFCELPYLLRDSTDKDALINGPLGARIKNEVLEKTGLRPIALFERGPRQLTSNRPIRHPDDLQGLIIRVPSVPSFVTAWNAMGAKPTPMAFSEVFTSLQQGAIEAQENPFELILNAGFPEVQEYVNLTEHVMSWSYPVVGEKQFQRLPPDLQEIFLRAALDMQAYERRLFLESQEKVKEALKARGMQFVAVDKEAFAESCREAIYNSLSPEMQALYQDFITSKNQ
ncbi:TRAP transporter substrate-binding protein [Flavilitoribacter nigricans]|uniref:C4-dicarboxylate ABC transporter n=1 Tax=Flavilitoribacter nigricans (strain ATCC 23147 / DSM 23189 / NBRC 102662 / NCIMB 1420 / SS-2) TaxID=1122177 RepID=A0A2D0N2R4_FLAN2|nr:TRAP transporter substrate-binding protein [Flavilitoribacter nigricans]PHN02737.1 C4-dicarboxylate ABC transporter [Flavilitoribacter nigricans DSM 23189 = NBRC 102662]